MNTPAPSREAQELLDRLVEIPRRIEAHEAEVYRLCLERRRLQAESGPGATGHKPGERMQEDLL